MRMVVSRARYISRQRFSEDLVSHGALGVMRAIDKFDAERGFAFSTYAQNWIDMEIRNALLLERELKRSDAHRGSLLTKRLAIEELAGLPREAAIVKVAADLNMGEKTVRNILAEYTRGTLLSLDAPIGDDDSSAKLGDLVVDGAESAEQKLEATELDEAAKRVIARVRKTLDKRRLAILDLRLLSEDPKTLHEIGAMFGISRERARQLEVKVKRDLKRELHVSSASLGRAVEVAIVVEAPVAPAPIVKPQPKPWQPALIAQASEPTKLRNQLRVCKGCNGAFTPVWIGESYCSECKDKVPAHNRSKRADRRSPPRVVECPCGATFTCVKRGRTPKRCDVCRGLAPRPAPAAPAPATPDPLVALKQEVAKLLAAAEHLQRGANVIAELHGLPLPYPNVAPASAVPIANDVALAAIPRPKDPDAVSLGRRGGLKDGAARAAALSSEQRTAISKNAAKVRWS